MRHWSLIALAACVPSTSELRAPVSSELSRRLGPDMHEKIDELLAHPLEADTAIRIALANNPRLAATLDRLGIVGAELASALSLGPTEVDLQLRFGHGHEYELDAVQSVLGLITMSRRRDAAQDELVAAQDEAIATALRLAGRTEVAFHDLLAAQQELELRRTAFEAADAAATVRERMFAAGNTTALAQARDRDAREQARIEVARAEAAIGTHREAINALLGLSGKRTAWTATGTLADPPETAPMLADLEASSFNASLALAAGTAHRKAATARLDVERVRAWLPDVGLGVSAIDRDGTTEVGPALRLGIPLFDQRSGERAKARAEVHHAMSELFAVMLELGATARATRIAALAAYQEARSLHDVVLPLRQQIVDETLLHYNAMDADPFQLIAARRELVEGGHAYLEALRRYWNAMTEVDTLRRGAQLSCREDPC